MYKVSSRTTVVTFTRSFKDRCVHLYLDSLHASVQLEPQKTVWHEMMKDIRREFKSDLGRMKRQLSKTGEEIVPRMNCSGMSATRTVVS
jgi:hypothetical protein